MDSYEGGINPVAMTIINLHIGWDIYMDIGQTGGRTSNLLFSGQVHYQLSYVAWRIMYYYRLYHN